MKTPFRGRTSVVLLGGVVLFAVPVSTQTPESPAFEVASLRLRATPDAAGISPYGSGRWSANCLTLGQLLPRAFDLRTAVLPIEGLPDWARREYYAIAAKAEDGVILNRETLRPRLKRLIEERFNLVTHIETRNVKGYALVVARGGPRLQRSTTEDLNMLTAVGSGMIRNYSVTMDLFAGALEGLLKIETGEGAPVVNETGLTGYYDVKLSFAPLVDAGRLPRETNSSLPSLFTAIQEQLGLRLTSREGIPVPVLVIDHVEHPIVD